MTHEIIKTGIATAILPAREQNLSPITIIGTDAIRDNLEQTCLDQALNARSCPGVETLVVNPDAHQGYGAPIGCVLASKSHIYPGPVGVDIKCSMSLIQFSIKAKELDDKTLRRKLIDAICERVPTGMGNRAGPKARQISYENALRAVIEGATPAVCESLGIPAHWASRCEDAIHYGHDGTTARLRTRMDELIDLKVFKNLSEKLSQLGSYGGGNHFGECEAVSLIDSVLNKDVIDAFGLIDGNAAFLSHCGSRGFGNILATNQFKLLEEHFGKWNIPFPMGDKHLVYAPVGTPEANNYLDDMALGCNFSTINHLLINALVLEAFQEVIPGVTGELVYYISHNIARKEHYKNADTWVHRKGATRAFPANHVGLVGTPFEKTGHPILLPGNPVAGSVVMVALPGAEKSCYSVNHGAGRQLGRKAADRALDQDTVDQEFTDADILTNCRKYPKDEAPAAYKNFNDVLESVESAGLAKAVAKLSARFVIKDSSHADD